LKALVHVDEVETGGWRYTEL